MAPAPGQPVHSHMPRELSETGHAIVRSRTVTVFCRYHDNYISVVTGADQSGTEVGYKIVLPQSPWYLWLKTTLTLGLRPRVRVVYNHKSLATVVELLLIAWVSGQYGKILHECVKYFPEPKARENTAHESNVSPY